MPARRSLRRAALAAFATVAPFAGCSDLLGIHDIATVPEGGSEADVASASDGPIADAPPEAGPDAGDAATPVDGSTDSDAYEAATGPWCSSSVRTIAPMISAPTRIVVDSNDLYFLLDGPGVRKATLAAGVVTTLASDPMTAPSGLAIEPSGLYWSSGTVGPSGYGTIARASLDGGAPVTLASASGSYMWDVALYDGSVYWTEQTAGVGAVVTAATDGGTATTLASGMGTTPTDIAVGPSGVYWTDRSFVSWTGLDGDGVNLIQPGNGQANGPITLDSTSVYWADSQAGTIEKAALGGGAITTLASNQTRVSDVAVDANYVYWTVPGPPGRVMRTGLNGGAILGAAKSTRAIYAIALDASCVYFGDDQGIYAVAKP